MKNADFDEYAAIENGCHHLGLITLPGVQVWTVTQTVGPLSLYWHGGGIRKRRGRGLTIGGSDPVIVFTRMEETGMSTSGDWL